MQLRCTLDGLLLRAEFFPCKGELVVFEGDESFAMDALEARYYQLVAATRGEVLGLEGSRYRLLRRAADFDYVNE